VDELDANFWMQMIFWSVKKKERKVGTKTTDWLISLNRVMIGRLQKINT
jgi:hypothetical protein